jgi:hypothetical protein
MDKNAIEMAKDFELFGKRIEYIEPILKSEDDGIIINELSRICKKDPNQTRREIYELKEKDIINIENSKEKGKTGNKKYITLTEKGKILYYLFTQYFESTSKELINETNWKINNSIKRYRNSKSDIGKGKSLIYIREIIYTEIGKNNFNWIVTRDLINFINDFLKDLNNQNDSNKQQFFQILHILYSSGYIDDENINYLKSFLNKENIEECNRELTDIFAIAFFALKNKPNNKQFYRFLFFLIEKIQNLKSDYSNIIGSSREKIIHLPEHLKNKIFNDLDNMINESKVNDIPLIEILMEILSYVDR